MDGSGYGMNGAGSWMFGAFLLMGTVLLGVLVARWLYDSAARGRNVSMIPEKQPGRSEARVILDGRLARGELSPQEYRDRLETLHEPA